MESGPIELNLITSYQAIQLHGKVLGRDPGMPGVRCYNALQSALESPKRHLAYRNPEATLPELAAVMAYEVVKQHPFNDGNKRTAALLIPVFLRAHGIRWRPRQGELVQKMVALARSTADEQARLEVIERTAFWIELSEAEYAS